MVEPITPPDNHNAAPLPNTTSRRTDPNANLIYEPLTPEPLSQSEDTTATPVREAHGKTQRGVNSTSSNHQRSPRVSDHGVTRPHAGDRGRWDERQNNRLYQRRKCMIIHDSDISDFHQEKFSNQFDMKCIKASTVEKLSYNFRSLEKTISKENPECIFIHAGMEDLYALSDDNQILDNYWNLIGNTLDSALITANLCISLIIPTQGSHKLNRRIKCINDGIIKMVTDLRNDYPELRERLFTYSNNAVSWQNRCGLNGRVHLSDHGVRIMWQRLKDGLKKTLRLPRPTFINHSESNPRQNSNNLNNHRHG